MGFLWYNAYPAQMFMGDVGSLSLGAALGIVAVMTKNEILLIIVGGVFVMEALSVIFQVASYKFRRKRVFLMAPIHHHYELKGWKEPQIIVRFWIISFICAVIGLSTLETQMTAAMVNGAQRQKSFGHRAGAHRPRVRALSRATGAPRVWVSDLRRTDGAQARIESLAGACAQPIVWAAKNAAWLEGMDCVIPESGRAAGKSAAATRRWREVFRC